MSNITNKKILNVPPLRFKEFSDEWISFKANELFKFYSTNSLTWDDLTYMNGNIKNYHYGLIHKGLPILTVVKDNRIPFLKKDADRKNKEFVKRGDLIFADASEDYSGVAQTIEIIDDTIDAVAGLHTIHARQNENIFSLGFKGYMFNSSNVKKQFRRLAVGTKVYSISTNNFKDVLLSFPANINEQAKIVKVLYAIDQRIEIQRKLIENYESLSKSIYNLILHRYETTRITLKSLISKRIISPIKPSDLKKFDDERIYLSTSSIDGTQIVSDEGKITFQKRPSRASLMPFENSVWFAKMKNSIKVFLAKKDDEEKYILSTGYYGFKTNNILISQWLKFAFLSDEFNRQKDQFSEGSSMSGIKDNQLNDIYVQMIDNNQDLETSLIFLLNIESSIDCSKNELREFNILKIFLLENLFV